MIMRQKFALHSIALRITSYNVCYTKLLRNWGYHAGRSTWIDYENVKTLNDKFIGIEVVSAGKVEAVDSEANPPLYYKTWFGKTLNKEEVREINGEYFHKFTKEQEKSLIDLLVWLYKQNPEVFKIENIVGHCEVSPGRKVDPGGSLSLSMNELRKVVENLSQDS